MSFIKADNPKEQKHFDYLERLRQSGATNMWGAGRRLKKAFPRDFAKADAGDTLTKWMRLHEDPTRIIEK